MSQTRKSVWRIVGETLFGATPARLPRDQVIEALDDTITRSHNGQFVASVLMFEIDRFRHIEETRDTAEVAHILRVIEERTIDGPCRRDMIRAMGAGRFVVVPSALRQPDPDMLSNLASNIQALGDKMIHHPAQDTLVTISVGFATQVDIEGVDGTTIFEAANAALIAALKNGPAGVCSFSPAMHAEITSRRNLANEARQAILDGEIYAHFQPQVDIETHSIIGVEALARWQHPQRGMISPGEFLPVLEEAGLMPELGMAILHDALSAVHEWDHSGVSVPTISVNFSTEELLNPNLVDAIQLELDSFDLTPDRLVIEILETVVAGAKEDLIMRNISALHALGCAIDLDDFGTGHASITTIRKFEVDRIKIDRSFVSNIGEDLEQQQMVLAILTMSEQLQIAALAEGVETKTELAFLKEHGCNIIQGFAISKPMPRAEMPHWMMSHEFAPPTHGVRQAVQ